MKKFLVVILALVMLMPLAAVPSVAAMAEDTTTTESVAVSATETSSLWDILGVYPKVTVWDKDTGRLQCLVLEWQSFYQVLTYDVNTSTSTPATHTFLLDKKWVDDILSFAAQMMISD